jgi:hypothetical protein
MANNYEEMQKQLNDLEKTLGAEQYLEEVREIKKELEETWLKRYINNEPLGSMPPFMSSFYEPAVVKKISKSRKEKFKKIQEQITKLTDTLNNSTAIKPAELVVEQVVGAKPTEPVVGAKPAEFVVGSKPAVTPTVTPAVTPAAMPKTVLKGIKPITRQIDFYGIIYDPSNIYTYFQFYHNDPDTLIIYNENFDQYSDKSNLGKGSGNGIYRQVRSDCDDSVKDTRNDNKTKITTNHNKIDYTYPVESPCFGIPTGPGKSNDYIEGETTPEQVNECVIPPDNITKIVEAINAIVDYVNSNSDIKRILYACDDEKKMGLGTFTDHILSHKIVNVIWDEFLNLYNDKITKIATANGQHIDQFFVEIVDLGKIDFGTLSEYDVNVFNKYTFDYSHEVINDIRQKRNNFFYRDNIFLTAFGDEHTLYDKWIENNNKIIENLSELINYDKTPNKYYLLNICLYIAFLNITSNFPDTQFGEQRDAFISFLNRFAYVRYSLHTTDLNNKNKIFKYINYYIYSNLNNFIKTDTESYIYTLLVHQINRFSMLQNILQNSNNILYIHDSYNIGTESKWSDDFIEDKIIVKRNFKLIFTMLKTIFKEAQFQNYKSYNDTTIPAASDSIIYIFGIEYKYYNKNKDDEFITETGINIKTGVGIFKIITYVDAISDKKQKKLIEHYSFKYYYNDEDSKYIEYYDYNYEPPKINIKNYKLYENNGESYDIDSIENLVVPEIDDTYSWSDDIYLNNTNPVFHKYYEKTKYSVFDLLNMFNYDAEILEICESSGTIKKLYKDIKKYYIDTLITPYNTLIRDITTVTKRLKIFKYIELLKVYDEIYKILYAPKNNYMFNIIDNIKYIQSVLNIINEYTGGIDTSTLTFINVGNFNFMYDQIGLLYNHLYGKFGDLKILQKYEDVVSAEELFRADEDFGGGSRTKSLTKSSRESKYKQKQLELLRKLFR